MPDPAGRIEPRSKQETERMRIRPALEPRYVGKRREADIFPPRHHLEPLLDIGAVEQGERHHVAHRGKRHQIEKAEEIGPVIAGHGVTGLPQRPAGRRHEDQREAGGAQMALPRQIILPVGIDHRMHRGQDRTGKMVVDHHRLEAERRSGKQRIMGIDAAIERHQQPGALPRQALDRRPARPIALGDAIGNVHFRRDPERAQIEHEQRRRGNAVDIIIGDDADRLAGHDGTRQPLGSGFEVADRRRLRHERPQARAQYVLAGLDADAAACQDPAKDLRYAKPLADRQRRAPVLQPRAPVTTGQRPADIQEVPGRRHGWASGRRLRIQRTVPVAERMTMVWVVTCEARTGPPAAATRR